MLSRSIRKSVLDIRISSSTIPPAFLLPIRARYFNSTAQHVEPPSENFSAPQLSPENLLKSSGTHSTQSTSSSLSSPPPPPASLSPSVKELLPLLAAQPSHFISAHIHGRPYLVTAGDIVRLPFRMPGVVPGDVLRLNRASSLGSRDYTLKGAPYVDERIFECRARVLGTEAEPMRIKEKTKRRNRRVRTVRSKHKFTILRIAELKVNNLEDIEG
jgi:large subunit ribosomal protein L21